MIIKFPDGNLFEVGNGWEVAMSSSAPILYFYDQARGTASMFSFVCSSAVEQIFLLNEIYQAIRDKVDYLELESDAGLPTGGDTLSTDMFVNANSSAVPPVGVANNDSLFLTIGGYTTPTPWPPSANGLVSGMPATFLQGCSLTIGGQSVQNLQYVNGLCLKFNAPVLPAGTYNIVYTDGRGTVTKTNAVIYS